MNDSRRFRWFLAAAVAWLLALSAWNIAPTVIEWARPAPQPQPSLVAVESRAALIEYAQAVAKICRETEAKPTVRETGEVYRAADLKAREAFKAAMNKIMSQAIGDGDLDPAKWDELREGIAQGMEGVK